MQLTATTSTADGRLSAGMVYTGEIVNVNGHAIGLSALRFVCYDNKGEWMTFDLNVFVPLGEYLNEGVPKERFREARA